MKGWRVGLGMFLAQPWFIDEHHYNPLKLGSKCMFRFRLMLRLLHHVRLPELYVVARSHSVIDARIPVHTARIEVGAGADRR